MNAIGIVSCVGFAAALFGYGALARWRSARRSGWGHLRRRYPAARRQRRRGGDPGHLRQTVRINGHRYAEHLSVGLCGGGLRLGVPPAMGLFHRPLLIPWDDLDHADAADADGHAEADAAAELNLQVSDATAALTLTGPSADAVRRVLARRHSGRRSRPDRW